MGRRCSRGYRSMSTCSSWAGWSSARGRWRCGMSREGSHPSKDSLAQLLRALIGYELPVEPVPAALRSFGWDAPEPVVLLTREDIVRILDRYLAGKLTTEQV